MTDKTPAGDHGLYSGQEGDPLRARPDKVLVGSNDGGHPVDPADRHAEHRDIPADNGQRAWVDERTGEVHGSGAPDDGFDDGTPGA